MSDDFKITPDMLDLLKKTGDAGKIHTSSMSSCLCEELLDVVQWERKWYSGQMRGNKVVTPGVNYTDLLCSDCRKEFKDWPRIVCLGCRRLMGFYKPGKQATGFEFKKGGHYHIIQCPRCTQRCLATPVIEHEKFCRVNGIKTTTDKDLLQEIETKILQTERAAAILRAEFKASRKK